MIAQEITVNNSINCLKRDVQLNKKDVHKTKEFNEANDKSPLNLTVLVI